MIDETILKYLEYKAPQLNFKGLINFMVDSDIPFTNALILSSSAVAMLDGIYIDTNKISHYSDSMIFFIILHEICHYKRMVKLGRKEIIKRLSYEYFDDFATNLIQEEILADRYASLLFLKFNGFPVPRNHTQNLEVVENRERYMKTIEYAYGLIDNSEERYYKLINQFVIL